MKPKSGLKTAKILIIDDAVFFRKMYCDVLHNAGYEIVEASDGHEGIQKALEAHPDLILLDINMPKLDGLCTLERLKADNRTKDIKVIMLSAKDSLEDIRESLSLGAIDYFIKAINSPKKVIKTIGNSLKETHSEMAEQPAGRPEFNRLVRNYRIFLRDKEGEADDLVSDCRLPQRFWCPRCQGELVLELTPDTELTSDTLTKRTFKARLICARCGSVP